MSYPTVLSPDRVRRFGLIVKRHHPRALDTVREAVRQILASGGTVWMPTDYRSWWRKAAEPVQWIPIDTLADSVDCLIVLGGNGTFLYAVRMVAERAVPIMGIHLGRLGFLTEVTIEEIGAVFEAFRKGRLRIQPRTMLEAVVQTKAGPSEQFLVLNDVVINKMALARIIDLGLWVDGEFVTQYRADGLIIATPTGSTAYSLSAGGSIVHPSTPAILITPICPHALTQRPIVLPDTVTVEVSLESGDEVIVTLDGQRGCPVEAGDRVIVRKSSKPLLLVHHPSRSFYETLRMKLKWGE